MIKSMSVDELWDLIIKSLPVDQASEVIYFEEEVKKNIAKVMGEEG